MSNVPEPRKFCATNGCAITHLGVFTLGLALGWVFAPGESPNSVSATAGSASVTRNDALDYLPHRQAPDMIRTATLSEQSSSSIRTEQHRQESNDLALAAARTGIKAAIHVLPKPALDYAVQQFLPHETITAAQEIDTSAYLIGLFDIARGDGNTSQGVATANSVHVTTTEPTDAVESGRIPYTPAEGITASPFQQFEGQALRMLESGSATPTELGSATKRIYASFNSNSGDKYVLTKWTGPGGEVIDFKSYPIDDKKNVNYVWLERHGWQPGNYKVEYFSSATLKPLATGVFVIK